MARGADIDVDAARADTPGCAHVAHLNNAGAALPPRQVVDAVVSHLRHEERIGAYEAALIATPAVEHCYDALAELVGCSRDEIALTESATRAWDLAFSAFRLTKGDRVLLSRAEYASNVLACLQTAHRDGVVIEVVEDDAHGQLDVTDLERRLASGPAALVAVTHVPTQGGLVNPIADIGRVTKAAGVPFLVDACQSVGQLPINVNEIGCDLLSATGRKYLRAPRGTGFLYVRRELLSRLEPARVDLTGATWTSDDAFELRPDARRFEFFETSVAARIGLGVAVDIALAHGLTAIATHVVALAAKLRELLAATPGVTVQDLGVHKCGIVAFTVAGHTADAVVEACRAGGVNIWRSVASSARFDLPRRGLTEVVRASVHYYNTQEELHRLLAALRQLAG